MALYKLCGCGQEAGDEHVACTAQGTGNQGVSGAMGREAKG